MIIAFFQIDWVAYILGHPFSFFSLIIVIVWSALTYQKFRLEHNAIMKVCGLIPESSLTDAEKATLLVNHMTLREEFDVLRAEFEKFRTEMQTKFVTADACVLMHKQTDRLLAEILDRGKHHRREDPEKASEKD